MVARPVPTELSGNLLIFHYHEIKSTRVTRTRVYLCI